MNTRQIMIDLMSALSDLSYGNGEPDAANRIAVADLAIDLANAIEAGEPAPDVNSADWDWPSE